MKHLKLYEDMNTGEPKIGDYVIINTLSPTGERYLKQSLSDFINNNVTFNRILPLPDFDILTCLQKDKANLLQILQGSAII